MLRVREIVFPSEENTVSLMFCNVEVSLVKYLMSACLNIALHKVFMNPWFSYLLLYNKDGL